MQRDITIIEQYLAADEELKLSMFLTHRELRRHFVKIDMAAARLNHSKTAARQATKPSRRGAMGFHDLCLGWLKRYCTAR
jgi:hypothetical protein